MKEIADFVHQNEIAHDWRDHQFYIWPTYYDMEALKELIPWGITEYSMMDGCAISSDGVCIDLAELFGAREVEKYFPSKPPLPPPKIPLHVTVRTRKTAPVKGRLAGAGLIGRDVPRTI